MDTSKQYIKMCEGAKKIQEQWFPKMIDLLVGKGTHLKLYYPFELSMQTMPLQNDWIWLPRQDQLQAMLIPAPYSDWSNLIIFFSDWIMDVSHVQIRTFGSLEQLWLAFVMKQKYGKVWDGEKWETAGASKTRAGRE